jgi:hypothetical protein
MSSIKINQRIIEGIAEHSGGDEVIDKFLIGLLYEEAEHPGTWWWKEVYKRLVERSAAMWEASDED